MIQIKNRNHQINDKRFNHFSINWPQNTKIINYTTQQQKSEHSKRSNHWPTLNFFPPKKQTHKHPTTHYIPTTPTNPNPLIHQHPGSHTPSSIQYDTHNKTKPKPRKRSVMDDAIRLVNVTEPVKASTLVTANFHRSSASIFE